MRVFQRVVDEGGFALAARSLNISPTTVTRLIGDLEQHLGARLLQRTTRRMALTEAGENYLERLRLALQEWSMPRLLWQPTLRTCPVCFASCRRRLSPPICSRLPCRRGESSIHG
ncbi:LysR family transcriptional regulator [Variovorax sp. RA8]|uniref:LysR family transcriptional regulator n=1 Tax=Variovorax sp. (strain JCM 16519 / RA8) TaxID=662548 RepID=UPI003FCE1125